MRAVRTSLQFRLLLGLGAVLLLLGVLAAYGLLAVERVARAMDEVVEEIAVEERIVREVREDVHYASMAAHDYLFDRREDARQAFVDLGPQVDAAFGKALATSFGSAVESNLLQQAYTDWRAALEEAEALFSDEETGSDLAVGALAVRLDARLEAVVLTLDEVDDRARAEVDEEIARVHAIRTRVALITSIILVLGLLVSFAGGLWLARSVLSPLRDLAEGLRGFSGGTLTGPMPLQGVREIDEVSKAFNAMAENLTRSTSHLVSARDELQKQASTDPITQLLNHRYGSMALADAFGRARAENSPLSVLIADIDDFKLFNDVYGHTLGDDVLRSVASVLERSCNGGAIPCRYGGDEFLVIMPDRDRPAALRLAERVRKAAGEIDLRPSDGASVPLGLSVGVASFPEDGGTADHLLVLADAEMYEAKRLGSVNAENPGALLDRERPGGSFRVLDSLVQAIQHRDHYTREHSEVVAEYATRLAVASHCSEQVAHSLRVAGLLHDVGKIIVPDEILKKPGALSAAEYEIMKRHVLVGEMLLREGHYSETVVQAVGHHHERFDGRGYPRAVGGLDIPLAGRIISIADGYSAMCLDRPYRKGLAPEEVASRLRQGAGTQFDPDLTDLFLGVLEGERRSRAA